MYGIIALLVSLPAGVFAARIGEKRAQDRPNPKMPAQDSGRTRQISREAAGA
jgi:hypothetical protein